MKMQNGSCGEKREKRVVPSTYLKRLFIPALGPSPFSTLPLHQSLVHILSCSLSPWPGTQHQSPANQIANTIVIVRCLSSLPLQKSMARPLSPRVTPESVSTNQTKTWKQAHDMPISIFGRKDKAKLQVRNNGTLPKANNVHANVNDGVTMQEPAPSPFSSLSFFLFFFSFDLSPAFFSLARVCVDGLGLVPRMHLHPHCMHDTNGRLKR